MTPPKTAGRPIDACLRRPRNVAAMKLSMNINYSGDFHADVTRIQELENGCAPLVDAARTEGRAAMRDEIVLDISGKV